MSIENNLKRIADSLELIASVMSANPEVEDVTDKVKDAVAKRDIDSKPPGGKESEKVTPIKKAAKPVPEPEPKSEDEGPTREDVRAALQSLQKQTDATVARGVLKKFKAVTLSKLDADDYEKVIAMCAELQDE